MSNVIHQMADPVAASRLQNKLCSVVNQADESFATVAYALCLTLATAVMTIPYRSRDAILAAIPELLQAQVATLMDEADKP